MNQDISICVLTENEMGWTEPFELDKVQILDNYYWLDFERQQGLIQRVSDRMADGKIVCLAVIVSAIILRLLHRR